MPRRNTLSSINSLWSCSKIGVRLIGENPSAGKPICNFKSKFDRRYTTVNYKTSYLTQKSAISSCWKNFTLDLHFPMEIIPSLYEGKEKIIFKVVHSYMDSHAHENASHLLEKKTVREEENVFLNK